MIVTLSDADARERFVKLGELLAITSGGDPVIRDMAEAVVYLLAKEIDRQNREAAEAAERG